MKGFIDLKKYIIMNYVNFVLFCLAQTTDICYINEQSQKICYKDFGLGSWTAG